VGVHQLHRPEAVFFHISGKLVPFRLLLTSGIDDDAFTGMVIKKISVLLEGIKYECFDVYHESILLFIPEFH
jgi:hypothetical protein